MLYKNGLFSILLGKDCTCYLTFELIFDREESEGEGEWTRAAQLFDDYHRL